MSPEASPRAHTRGDLLMAIANRIVSLHKKFYGKGPTKARAFYQDDLVVVLSRGGFSTVEETLYRAGRSAAVIAQRAEFQDAVKGEFVAAVEELTGRRVLAFMSANHQDPDMAAELFVLESAEAECKATPVGRSGAEVSQPRGASAESHGHRSHPESAEADEDAQAAPPPPRREEDQQDAPESPGPHPDPDPEAPAESGPGPEPGPHPDPEPD